MRMLEAYRRMLRNPALARLFAGEFVSGIGDWLYLVALLIVIYAENRDPVILGVVGAARVVPYIVLSVPAGIVADRYDRRMILLVTDLMRGAIMVVIAVIVAFEGPLLAVVALAILATCFSSFFYPAIGALIPSLAKDESELGPANSAWASLDNLAFVIGPALAGILIAVGGIVLAFVLNAITFVVIAAVLWRLPRPVRAVATASPGVTPGGALEAVGATADESAASAGESAASAGESAAGGGESVPSLLDHLRRVARPFSGIVLVYSAGSFVFGGLSIATVVLAVDVLKAGDEATGYLNAAIGVGGLAGALIAGALVLRRSLGPPLLGGAVAFGVGLVLLGAVPSLGVALVAIGVAALGSLVIDVGSTTIFQRTIPDEVRGRTLGVMNTVAVSAYAVGAFAVPVLLQSLGAGLVLAGLGAVIVAATGAGLVLIGPAAVQAPVVPAEAMRLVRLPVFAGLPTARLDAALQRVELRTVRAGETVIHEGAPPDRFYVIAEGRFVVTQRDPAGGPERLLRALGPDEVFGEIGLLTGQPRSATVAAESAGTLLTLEGAAFLELVGAGPGLGDRLLGLYASPGGAAPVRVGAATSQ